ncbi:hypothetical protein I4U23_021586 [Adineta vaga]|nr:hypothetical protein I4U23_021586 [Adineta vaga]
MNNRECRINACGRTKSTWSFTRQTTKQDFDQFLKSWINTNELKEYVVLYEDYKSKDKRILDIDQPNFLTTLFDSLNTTIGVHSSMTDVDYINIFIEPKIHTDIYPEESLLSPCLLSAYQTFFENPLAQEDLLCQENYVDGSKEIDNMANTIDYNSSTKQVSQLITYQTEEVAPTTTTSASNSSPDVDHIRMILDVNPNPGRMRYKSDVIPKRSLGERRITIQQKPSYSLLSDEKRSDQKGKHIWPIIEIPSSAIQYMPNGVPVRLQIAAVIEEKSNNERIWKLHQVCEFHHPGYDGTSIGVNPIEILLDSETVQHRQYTIKIILVRKPGMIGIDSKGQEFHRLDEMMAQKLHSAEHSDKLIRLAFVLKINEETNMKTFGVSDFMDFKSKSKNEQVSIPSKTCSECNRTIPTKQCGKKVKYI